MTQNRLKSKILWTGLVSLIVLIGSNYGLWAWINMPQETFQTATDIILSVLIGLGIINNPSDSEKI